ncbi:MAG TPA: hypothetical protein VFB60_06065 [Ktedonobacteraceae bacterium]|nr:hypothetical protein [Ktedonobacteraceae bacterium]
MQNSPQDPMQAVFAFTDEEVITVQQMLETLVRALREVPGGGKVEEGYWSYIYHAIRKAPVASWSNLPMRDFCHNGLGVEMKLLQRRAPSLDQGHRLMHPAATRTVTFDPDQSAEICKEQVLTQFANQIMEFRDRTAKTCLDCTPDIRWGIFLWSPALNEFLYFEEALREPDPDNFYAEFVASFHRGKARRNLHIFEKATGIKRYSVTMPDKGAKVQPYFDIPTVEKGAYLFKVPDDGRKPLWLKEETLLALQRVSRSQERDIDEIIIAALSAL